MTEKTKPKKDEAAEDKTAAKGKRTRADVKSASHPFAQNLGKSTTKSGPAKTVTAKPMRKASSKGR